MSQVDEQEILARYIYSKNHYRPSDRTVRHSAFMPPPDKCLSVFRISGLHESDIWGIGGNLRAQSLLGRADIKAFTVFETGLFIDSDNIPLHHANIIGWPVDSSEIKLKAIELAKKAQLHLK